MCSDVDVDDLQDEDQHQNGTKVIFGETSSDIAGWLAKRLALLLVLGGKNGAIHRPLIFFISQYFFVTLES